METDWMWCYENPKEAAAFIDQLAERVQIAFQDGIKLGLQGGTRPQYPDWANLQNKDSDAPLGSPVRYTDGSMSREYDEQPTQNRGYCGTCGAEHPAHMPDCQYYPTRGSDNA